VLAELFAAFSEPSLWHVFEEVREVLAALRDWDGRVVAVEVVDAASDAAGARSRLSASFATARGPAETIVGRWDPEDGSGRLHVAGLPGATGEAVARVSLPGRHNAENGLVSAGVALAAGAAPAAVLAALASYEGVGRRLEVVVDTAGIVVLDDYGHHPTAMRATFAAVRDRYPGRRLWAVYEPLTYHRTAAMLDAFAEVLEEADRVVVAQIHAGRDPDTSITSAGALAAAVAARGRRPAWAPGTVEETADWLADRVAPGDVVLVMGGGRSYVCASRLAALLEGRQPT
jgi:UDP-N-acetylmuramate--alanine ligase